MADTRETDTVQLASVERKDETFGVRIGDDIADKYEIITRLGSGGMGAVFQARHKTIGKLVAIKILRSDLATDPQQTARFLQEARAANEVTHRNIVEVLDFGSHDGRPYMVMELLRGEALSALMHREGQLPPATIIRILSPVLRALASAHQRGVIHRDIKPENIFLVGEEDGDAPIPKILDFGIAKRLVPDDVRLTDTRAAFGTPAYMAPEQAMGARDVSPAADQYAVGVVLFEALSGRLPHVGDTYNAIIVAKVTNPPKDLHGICPELDPTLSAVVMRALQRDPANRYPSVGALREALDPFGGLDTVPPNRSLPSTPRISTQSDLELGATVPAARSDPNAVVPTPGSWSVDTLSPNRRRRSRTARAIVAGLIGVGFLAWQQLRPRQHRTTTTGGHATPTTVVFHIEVSPPSADIRLDGVLVGHGRVELVRPRDTAQHLLHASADGFGDFDEVLRGNSDAQIARSLEPVSGVPMPVSPAIEPPAADAGASHSTPRVLRPVHSHPASDDPPPDPRHPRMDRDIHL